MSQEDQDQQYLTYSWNIEILITIALNLKLLLKFWNAKAEPMANNSNFLLLFSLWLFVTHGQQHTRLPCPPLSPGVSLNSCPLSRWCYLTISSFATLFSFCLQSFPASGSFPVSWLFASGDQSTGASASASVLPMNIQDWFPLGWAGWISLQSKGLSRGFSSTAIRKH